MPSVDRSILNPVSLLELSIHARLIRLEDAAVAASALGAAGMAAGDRPAKSGAELIIRNDVVTTWMSLRLFIAKNLSYNLQRLFRYLPD